VDSPKPAVVPIPIPIPAVHPNTPKIGRITLPLSKEDVGKIMERHLKQLLEQMRRIVGIEAMIDMLDSHFDAVMNALSIG